jgi:putative aldouronate transport system substrate-binding protein
MAALVGLLACAAMAFGSPGAEKTGTAMGALNSVGSYPIAKQKVDLKVFAGVNPNWADPARVEVDFFKWLEEKTNVHVAWETVPEADAQTKMNLMLSAGDYPGVAFGRTGFTLPMLTKYGADGTVLALEGLIDQYSPNIKAAFAKRPQYLAQSKSLDGHLYTLGQYKEGSTWTSWEHMYVNKEWLARLGLKVPTTTEEVRTVLRAFVTKDPNGNGKNDEIGLAFQFGAWHTHIGHFFGPFGIIDDPFNHLFVDDKTKKVLSTATDQRFRNAVKYYASLYAEGLIDPESFVQAQEQVEAKAIDSRVGMAPDWDSSYLSKANNTDDAARIWAVVPPVAGPDGTRLSKRAYQEVSLPSFVVTDRAASAELAMRWVDTFFEDQTSWEASWGRVGVRFKMGTDGKYHDDPDVKRTDVTYPFPPVAELLPGFASQIALSVADQQKRSDQAAYAPFYGKEALHVLWMSEEDTKKVATLNADINPFINERMAGWLTNKTSIDAEWDAFQQELVRRGIKEYVAIYQKYQDAYYALVK